MGQRSAPREDDEGDDDNDDDDDDDDEGKWYVDGDAHELGDVARGGLLELVPEAREASVAHYRQRRPHLLFIAPVTPTHHCQWHHHHHRRLRLRRRHHSPGEKRAEKANLEAVLGLVLNADHGLLTVAHLLDELRHRALHDLHAAPGWVSHGGKSEDEDEDEEKERRR